MKGKMEIEKGGNPGRQSKVGYYILEKIKRISRYELYSLILLVLLVVLFGWLQRMTDIGALSFIFKTISALSDSFLIILPFLFLRGRWRISLPLFSTVMVIVVEANAIYYRNFGDLITGSLYFSNFKDPTITEGAIATIGISDVIPLSILLSIWIFWWLLGQRSLFRSSMGGRYRVIWIAVTISLWVVSLGGACRRTAIHRGVEGIGNILKETMVGKSLTWQGYYFNRNFCGYLLTSVAQSINKYHELSDEDIRLIKTTLKNELSSGVSNYELTDSIRPDNLIIIVVESLQSNVFDLAGSRKIAPNMISLASDSLNVFVKECKVLAGAGRSSDGQFIINTGLLPLRGEALVTDYAAGDYPGLAKAFNGETLEVIGERRSLWSHGVTTVSYGYDRLVDDIAADVEFNQDSLIFHCAATEIKQLKQPFFLFLTTLSMHDPYLRSRVSSSLQESDLQAVKDKRDREYLRRVNHCDHQLGWFIDFLKKEGLFDNTCLVITGDHAISQEDISERMHSLTVPLIIVNSGRINYRKENITQLDIFPTLIEIFNPRYSYDRFEIPYTGLGESIFHATPGMEITEEDYQASELIIRSKNIIKRRGNE